MNDLSEIDALVRARLRNTSQMEIAVVSEVAADGLSARVKRQGQTTATKFLPLATGLVVVVNERVQIVRINGDLNTAYIAAKV